MPQTSDPRSYAVVGTGAIGGYYGACLQKAGLEVHFLLRSDYDHVRHHGLTVESPDGDFTLPQVNAYASVDAMPACDVVIVALKATQNHLLTSLLPPLVKPSGVVLLLQNGLGVEETIANMISGCRVMGGLCFICSNKVGPGHIRHLDYKAIALGEYAPNYAAAGVSDAMEAIAQDFESAGVPIVRSEDLLLARWQKLLWNVPFNGLSVVLNAMTDAMIHHPQVRKLAEDLMDEVRAIAAAYGREINDAYVQKILTNTETMKPYRTSMKIDYDEQRPLEVEAIFGTPFKAAQAQRVPAPKLEMLYQQLVFLDAQNT